MLILLAGAAARAQTSPPPTTGPAEDGQWPVVGKDKANTRYSGLDQITTDNAKDLKVAWTFDTGVNRGQEAAPIVVGGVMYVVTPYPNFVYALALGSSSSEPYTLKWKYEPKPAAAAQGVACCDYVNRGLAVEGDRVYLNTLDGHTICLDAGSGKERWKTKVAEINKGETITMAPMVVKGKVLVGDSGGEFGVRGSLAALDTETGEIAWRAYSTGPDSECLIGPEFKPFYDMDKGTDLGVSTWPPGMWQTGGGTVWGFLSYDADLDLVYYGTANPGPWSSTMRPGDNKWTCGLFARRPSDGHALWYYQWSPHDIHDWDGVNENVLLDVDVDGAARKVLVHPDRNGYMYVMDRTNGEVLSATQYTRNTATLGVDLTSGRLSYNPEKEPKSNQIIRDIQPFAPGAKDWQPMAWSPRTRMLYVPHQNMAMDWEEGEANYIAGTPYLGIEARYYAGPGGNRGVFGAWDLDKKSWAWTIPENFPVWSGALVTAGDVAFYGTMEGWFKAVDAKTGEELWRFKTGSGIIGQPVTYRGPDGKQYVAILSGVGGWAGAIVSGDLDPRDPTGALGFVNGMKDLPKVTSKGGTLYVFALP